MSAEKQKQYRDRLKIKLKSEGRSKLKLYPLNENIQAIKDFAVRLEEKGNERG